MDILDLSPIEQAGEEQELKLGLCITTIKAPFLLNEKDSQESGLKHLGIKDVDDFLLNLNKQARSKQGLKGKTPILSLSGIRNFLS